MLKVFFALVIMSAAILMSGCLTSDAEKFRMDGDTVLESKVFEKFTIVDLTKGMENVSYTVDWADGMVTNIKSMPINATVPLKHAWFFPGNYTIRATAIYGDGSTFAVNKMIEVRD